MPVRLKDLPRNNRGKTGDRGLAAYANSPKIARLGWPIEVVKQWLYDHRQYGPFLRDYASVDLSQIGWSLENVPSSDLEIMPTGPSEQDNIAIFAASHQHYVDNRRAGWPGLAEAWESLGTWLVPPLLISRDLLDPPRVGLQVVEGRTRVGILRGRRTDGRKVAETHKAWVGRRTLIERESARHDHEDRLGRNELET